MRTNRIEYIDELRGFAILLVVAGHLIQYNSFFINNPAFEFIYSFHMPLFFAISGYVTEKVTSITNVSQYAGFIKRKFISIALPLLTWSIMINPFLSYVKDGRFNIDYSFTILWFLKVLFIILCIYGLFNFFNNTIKIKSIYRVSISIILVITISILLIVINVMELNLILYSISFYWGVFISGNTILEEKCTNSFIYTLSALLFMITSVLWSYNGSYLNDIIKIAASISAFTFFLNLFQKLKLSFITKNNLQLFGRYSLSIYLVQFQLCNILPENLYIDNYLCNSIILFLISIVISIPISHICIVFARIIQTNKILNLFIFGKI